MGCFSVGRSLPAAGAGMGADRESDFDGWSGDGVDDRPCADPVGYCVADFLERRAAEG